MKTKILLLFILFFSVAGCSSSSVYDNYIEINNKKINLIGVADNSDLSYMGLSFRESICENCGMLFPFEEKSEKTFVMRDMLFPLDIIWISDDIIVKIDKNLPPEGSNPKNFYKSETPVNFVLEVNGGFTDDYNIGVGDKVNFNLIGYDFDK